MVVVELEDAPLAGARGLQAVERGRVIEAAQRRLEARILAAVPGAEVRWRYRRVLAGLAVALPPGGVARIEALPGVARVYPSVTYRPQLDASPTQIGAPALWGPGLDGTTGRGLRIGIIDDGIDPSHPFFADAGLAPPPGFPKGDRRYTTPKIIVARAFAPAGTTYRDASRPFDPALSGHGTHVAGIAAGAPGTRVPAGAGRPALVLSGVAPLAYLGNYKALTVPTDGFGLNGNSPELVAAIEAAVEDGMDVINLSLGQPEVPPERDVVAKALDNAAAAGVVAVVSAGNDFDELGAGSVTSPSTARGAISVAAVTESVLYGVSARILGPGPVPLELAPFAGLPSPEPLPEGRRPLVDVAGLGADRRLCGPAPLAPGALAGDVALVARGGCLFERKAENAAAAGAVGIIVADDGSGGFREPAGEFAVPVLVVTRETGDALIALAATAPGGALELELDGTAAAVQVSGGVIASFSSAGPTPLGLVAKPDVAAPGVDILSSVPRRDGLYDTLSGTSMAAPHVAGAAALLLERHPDWTPAQVKSALVTTGAPVPTRENGGQAPSTRQGGGLVDLPRADSPLLFADPQTLSLGLFEAGHAPAASRTIVLTDAGGGAGPWQVEVDALRGAGPEVPAVVTVPGELRVTARTGPDARAGDRTGFVVLSRGGETRRIPYWFAVGRPRLASVRATLLRRPGTYTATTAGQPARVERYRYPDAAAGLPLRLAGPERVFRIVLPRPVANLGVAVISRQRGVTVEPRVVAGADENRLLGVVALPLVTNPYLADFYARTPTAAAIRPGPGTYSLVFDSPGRRGAGAFEFRVWIDDVTPPRIALLSRSGRLIRARVTDAGAGVDPRAVTFALDGHDERNARFDPVTGIAELDLGAARTGRHRIAVTASDRQEAKNTENSGGIRPNTRVLRATVTVP